jgi:uncharacterized membrane protein HdeD (DUF308 family)
VPSVHFDRNDGVLAVILCHVCFFALALLFSSLVALISTCAAQGGALTIFTGFQHKESLGKACPLIVFFQSHSSF